LAGCLLPLAANVPARSDDQNGLNILRDKAVSAFRSGRYDEAISNYEQIAVLQPKNVDTLRDLMWAQWQGHHYREAADTASRITDLLPDDIEAWNLKARAYQAAGDKQQALKAYQKCLSLDPDNAQIRGAIANLQVETREYDQSIKELRKIQNSLPNEANVYSRLGQVESRQGLYDEAAETWGKAAERFPGNINFQFQAAKAVYYSGRPDEGIAKIKNILLSNPGFWPAIDFVIADAIVRGDLRTAQEILENNLSGFEIEDEYRMLKLAKIYEASGDIDKSLKTLNRLLNLNPNNGFAALTKADALMSQRRYAEAAAVYEHIYQVNPWSIQGMRGYAEAQSGLNHPEKALKAIQQAEQMDPTDPYLILLEGRYLYESGKNKQSKEIMTKWIHDNPEPAVPILLYHGLTPNARDPMLAETVHMTTAAFESQMAALQQAGYTAVTAEQVDGWSRWLRTLPPKSVLITFDDGRIDSFKYASPILERYGMRATMNVIGANVDGDFPGYANWEMLEKYQSSGLWEMEAHSDLAHKEYPIDAEGHTGMFLVNRLWLDKEQRMETTAEWIARILNDHRSIKHKISDHLGRVPTAYAFPEGEFGQDNIPNIPEAGNVNLSLARKLFGTAYHQDSYGLNARSKDSMLLARLEPAQWWTGDQLILHFRDQNPRTLMYRQLLRQAAWDERNHEAYYWLKQLEDSDASRAVLLADESRIRYSAGDYAGAENLAQRSLTINKDADVERLLKMAEAHKGFTWSPDFTYWQDNQDRQNWAIQNNTDFKLVGNTRMSLSQTYASYIESSTPTVIDKAFGIGIIQPLGLFHTLTIQGGGHYLTSQDATYSATGILKSKWTDYLSTTLEGGRGLTDTAGALNNAIFTRYVHANGVWTDKAETWTLSLKTKAAFLTDQNRELEGETQVGYQIFPGINLKGVYRFTIDDMKYISPAYYSPDGVILNQIGVQYSTQGNRPVQAYISFLPGIGTDRVTKPEFNQAIELGVPIKFDEVTRLGPTFSYTTTPSYNRTTYELTFSHQF
jgi:tetratricopeptide (TPR) repeat protein